jgi:predicted small metal-binding protein
MAKVYTITCTDVGVDCDFTTRGNTVEEVIELCADHGREVHGMKSFGPEVYAKMRACLKEVDEEPAR